MPRVDADSERDRFAFANVHAAAVSIVKPGTYIYDTAGAQSLHISIPFTNTNGAADNGAASRHYRISSSLG